MTDLFSTMDLVVLAIGTVILLIWLYFYAAGKKYEGLFENLDQEDYPMGDTYFVGFAVTQMLKLEYKDAASRRLRKKLNVLYEPKYADYYIRVVYSMQFTMALTVAAFAAPLYFLSDNIAMFGFMLIAAGVVYYYYGISMDDKLQKRADAMLTDFSEVVSKLAILVNSGMILTEAWNRVAYSGETILYKEMQKSVDLIRNGYSAADAIFHFGQRCMLPEVKKFSTTLIQGIMLSNSDLSVALIQQSKEVWDMKRQIVRRKGELANNKLLIPMVVSFMGIMIMVVVPIFANLGA